MTQVQSKQTLYEQDLAAWFNDTIAKLRAKDFDAIDMDSLIEEIEGLAGRDRRELKNRFTVLLAHFLKRLYVNAPENYRGWELTIREQRNQLSDLLEQSPSLRNYLVNNFSMIWQRALSDVQAEYLDTQFPAEWQFSFDIEALLTETFW
jgi:Domain of unknown function DUF29